MYRTRRRMLIALGGPFRGPARRDDAGGTGTSTGSGTADNGGGGTDSTDTSGDAGKTGDDASKSPQIDGDLDKDRAARSIAAARDGEKKAKDAAKAANERLAAVLKAAGLTPDGKTDPAEQLKEAAAKAETATAKARTSAIKLAVHENAGKAGVDARAVIDSSSFLTATAGLDQDAADFEDKVTAAMKAALKANPRLAAQQPAGKLGADHAGSGGSGSIDEQIAAATKAGRHAEAIALKRQKAYTARA